MATVASQTREQLEADLLAAVRAYLRITTGEPIGSLVALAPETSLKPAQCHASRARRAILSPLSEQIVLLLEREHPLKTGTIARRLQWQESTSTLRTILANLRQCGILAHHGDGYELADPFWGVLAHHGDRPLLLVCG